MDTKWLLEENMLVKEFRFKDFLEAMGFVNRVAEISDKLKHHPNILIKYDIVRISLQTHDINDVSDIDYKLADLIDHIVKKFYK